MAGGADLEAGPLLISLVTHKGEPRRIEAPVVLVVVTSAPSPHGSPVECHRGNGISGPV